MCGIVGYVGKQDAWPIIYEGLRRLEYRGYDSAGIAIVTGQGDLQVRKTVGKVHGLDEATISNQPHGFVDSGTPAGPHTDDLPMKTPIPTWTVSLVSPWSITASLKTTLN